MMQKSQFQNLSWSESILFFNGQTQSRIVKTCGMQLRGLFFPQTWNASEISFEISMDGENFYDLVNVDGDSISILTAAGTALPIVPYLVDFAPYFRFTCTVPQENELIVLAAMMPIYQLENQ